MKLCFQPYKDILKQTLYVAVASFLVQTISRIREGNKVQVVDESDFNVYASDAAMSSSELVTLLACSSSRSPAGTSAMVPPFIPVDGAGAAGRRLVAYSEMEPG